MNSEQVSWLRVRSSVISLVLLFGAAVAFGAQPAANPFKVGEEVMLFADSHGKGQQDTPHVVFGKDQYLVVWREGSLVDDGRARILASRVSTDGKVLDNKSIALAPNKNSGSHQSNPRVVFSKGVFLVVWQDFRNGKDYDILGARVTPDGKVLDAVPIGIATGGGTQAMPDVATDGNGFMVVFQTHPDSPQSLRYNSMAVPVSVEGKVGSAREVSDQPHPKIAWDGASYLVVSGGVHWDFAGTIFGQLLGSDGKAKGPPFTIKAGGAAPMLSISAQPGKGWLLVTHRALTDFWGWNGPGAMKSYFVASDGKPSADIPRPPSGNWNKMPNWLDILDKNAKTIPYGPNAAAWDGQHFLVVWQRFHRLPPRGFSIPLANCDLVAARVDGWKPVDSDGVPVVSSPADEKWPALACEGQGKFLFVYTKGMPDGRVSICARTIKTE